jgi:hypothetical protein
MVQKDNRLSGGKIKFTDEMIWWVGKAQPPKGAYAPYNNCMAAAMSSAIIWRLTFSMKKLGPACT